MKKPFLHALLAALYVAGIVLIIQTIASALKAQHDTVIIPMTMLSLFVLSAAIMGYLFLAEPLQLLLENRKKEAMDFFTKVVGFFAVFVAVFTILLFLFPGAPTKTPNTNTEGGPISGKLNINVVCENALSYMTFSDSASADKFVAECKNGEHPEVIERYKAQMNLGNGATI